MEVKWGSEEKVILVKVRFSPDYRASRSPSACPVGAGWPQAGAVRNCTCKRSLSWSRDPVMVRVMIIVIVMLQEILT